jgi:hypothetical protein
MKQFFTINDRLLVVLYLSYLEIEISFPYPAD